MQRLALGHDFFRFKANIASKMTVLSQSKGEMLTDRWLTTGS
jgi:hypothetical protein